MGLPDNAKDTLRKGRGFVGGLFSGFNRGRHQRRTPDAYDRKLSAMAEASERAHRGEGPVENYMFIDPEAAAIRRERMRERGGSESVSTTPERPNAQPPQIDARSESPNNANAAAGLERRAGYDKETGGESLKARALAAVGRFGRFLKNKYNQMTSRMNGYMSNRQQQRELSRLSREYGGSLGADLAYAADNLGRSATTSPERPDAQPSRANTQPEVNTPNQPQQAEQSNQSAESAPVTYPEMAASDNDDGGNLNDNQERNHDEEGKNETRGETLDEKEMMKQTWDSAKLLTQMINDWRLRQGNSLGRAVSSDEFNDQLGAAATLFDAPVDGPISLNGDGFVAFSEYMKQLPTNQEPSLEDFVKHYNK